MIKDRTSNNDDKTASRNRVILVALLLVIVVLVGALSCSLWLVPVRALPNSEFLRTEAMTPAQIDVTVEGAIRRAKRDYFFHPVDFRTSRELIFKEARIIAPNDMYLVFYLKNDPADYLILYRVAREDGRLLWKAGVSTGG
jgi:hypothetical protein